MPILSSSASIKIYKVEGEIEGSIIQTIEEQLKKHTIIEIEDNSTSEISVGWTSTQNPFEPYFEDSSFLIGQFFVFSLRIDKKKIPSALLKKKLSLETQKRLKETGKFFLSKSEKQRLKEQVVEGLLRKTDPTPYVYDLIWNYEDKELFFYSCHKVANEELEVLFSKSFGLLLIALFPYTTADLTFDFKEEDKDKLNKLTPVNFGG